MGWAGSGQMLWSPPEDRPGLGVGLCLLAQGEGAPHTGPEGKLGPPGGAGPGGRPACWGHTRARVAGSEGAGGGEGARAGHPGLVGLVENIPESR